MGDAVCRSMDPELFFPTRYEPSAYREARAVCRRCPVATQCADYAIANRERFGMWGGLSPDQRDAIRSRRSAERAAAAKEAG